MDDRGRHQKHGSSRPPRVHLEPGLGAELLAELAPLLADEGIDLERLDHWDPRRLQEALNRAAERINLVRFTPVGSIRSLAASALREAVDALAAGEPEAVRAVLQRVQPESSDGCEPTFAACIGVTLGLLDDWLSAEHSDAPAGLGGRVDVPVANSDSERAVGEIVTLARRGAAYSSLGGLVSHYSGENLLLGCVSALCVVVRAWSIESHRSVATVLLDHLR